jgi:hypothetical protein
MTLGLPGVILAFRYNGCGDECSTLSRYTKTLGFVTDRFSQVAK